MRGELEHMQTLREFSNLKKEDTAIAGGKGASLGEMTQAGIPVPPGFVILANTFRRFIQSNKLEFQIDQILKTVDTKNTPSVQQAALKIRTLIDNAETPQETQVEIMRAFDKLGAQYVAVRSSATAEDSSTASWAGELETYLNTTRNDLLKTVKQCWSSLFTPQAIFYRIEKQLHEDEVAVAVVVQKMIDSEIAGICFTVHPVTKDKNSIVIEAGWGLGETIVGGQITPDNYVVEKDTLKVRGVRLSVQEVMLIRGSSGSEEVIVPAELREKKKLTENQIIELAEMCRGIESHYEFPCDIEWAFENENFYIVQSRPITTLTDKVESKGGFKKDDYILSFWVQGVSVFVTDIHLEAYRELEVLYIIDNGMFKQYFTKKAYEHALDRGLKFYSDQNAFSDYQKDLTAHCDSFRKFFESEIKDKQSLSKNAVIKFFEYTKKLCGDYAKMNLEFTDKAFSKQEESSIIKKNLAGVAKFKDTARAVMNIVLFEPNGYSNQFFNILGRQFNISPAIFENLTQREILKLLDGKKPDENIISKRQSAFVESYNTTGFYEGKDAEQILQEFKEEATYSEIINGQTASKGKVGGRVKIIPVDYGDLKRVNTEIEKMKQGDILVAETTAPELIVACKKAGAIVTDMGGLMSHAAIVSREFGIPCVVGTKNASKILKDGDKVEVDGNLGVVRILK